MTTVFWVAMIGLVVAFTAIFVLDERFRHRRSWRINEAINGQHCPRCGGSFKKWCGQMSNNHYNFGDEVSIPDVILLSCSDCQCEVDAFVYDDGIIEIQEPWQ